MTFESRHRPTPASATDCGRWPRRRARCATLTRERFKRDWRGDPWLTPSGRVRPTNCDPVWDNLVPTLREVLLGFAVSLTGAFELSILLDRSGLARRSLTPVLIGSQTLPIIVLAPLVVIWFGFGLTPKIRSSPS